MLMVLNLRYIGIVLTLFFYIVLIAVTLIIQEGSLNQYNTRGKKRNRKDPINKTVKRSILFVVTSLMFIIVVYGFVSSKMFNASDYQQMITVNESGNFSDDFEKVNINELPIVDQNFAMRLGDKVLGEKFTDSSGDVINYGSEYEVRQFYDIYYKGQPYMIAPLSYRGLFKWMNNKEGTPGYVLVDKYTGDRDLITSINNKDIKMKYMPSSYFGKDLKRHLYQNGFRHQQLYDYIFEIDESGHPYWVVIETAYTININGGKDVNRVITVDAQSGDIKAYKPSEAPEWIDNIYPTDLVNNQLNYWGKFKNGYLNSIFGQKGVNQTTDGSRHIYDSNELYHYTGFTSVGGDESSTGFVYVNTRTKAANLYAIVGATEDAAMKSAVGQVKNFDGYHATFPISLNVNNQPTFFITIKDSNGIIKKYTFVNIEDYRKVGLGDTIQGAYNHYLNVLDEGGIISDNEDLTDITAVVERINWNIVEGQTIYYIKFDNDETIYSAKYTLSKELPITKAGDLISIKVTGDIIKWFDNNTLSN